MDQTEQKARGFLEMISAKVKPLQATVVGLEGDLGSGKTTFTQITGKLLGVEETIQSPTYVIQKIYKTKHSHFKTFYHLDLYRIEDPQELNMLHLDEVFNNPENLVFIEWPEKAEGSQGSPLASDMIRIKFEFVDQNTRNISYGN